MSANRRLKWLLILVALAVPAVVLAHGLLGSHGDRYNYVFATTGGPEGWPIWIESIVLDDRVHVPGGIVRSISWNEPPTRAGSSDLLGPQRLPTSLYARWFSFRSQTFYEIELDLPEAWKADAHEVYRQYRNNRRYRHHLLIGLSGDGRARLWWRSSCGWLCDDDPILIPIVEQAYAWEVDGDPSHYQQRTERRRELGRIPPEAEPPPQW